jgi:hypothetical protein
MFVFATGLRKFAFHVLPGVFKFLVFYHELFDCNFIVIADDERPRV